MGALFTLGELLLRYILVMIPLIIAQRVLRWLCRKCRTAELRQQEIWEQEGGKHYRIKSDVSLIALTGTTGLMGVIMTAFSFLMKEEWWVILGFAVLGLGGFLGVLNTSLWKIEVEEMTIIYRSTFGRVRHYDFSEITQGVYKRSGALRIYAGKKRLFTFDDNMDFEKFLQQMKWMKIPIQTMIEYKNNRKF